MRIWRLLIMHENINIIETVYINKFVAVPPPPPEPYEILKCRENEMQREIQRLQTLSNTLRFIIEAVYILNYVIIVLPLQSYCILTTDRSEKPAILHLLE